MKRIQIVTLCVVFPLIALGLAFFLTIYNDASSYTFAAHSLRLPFFIFLKFFLACLGLLIGTWRGIAMVEKKFF